MTIRFAHPGFIRNRGRDLWFNILGTGVPKMMDGNDFPWQTIAQTQLDEWRDVCAFKLERGDWLVLDNMRVLHGRLLYIENPSGEAPRTLLTVYTE